MNFLSALMIVFMAATASASDVAPVPARDFDKVLKNVVIDGQVQPENVATVVVQAEAGLITVSILKDICGQFADPTPGVVRCMAAAQVISRLEVPLTVVRDECGSMVYMGEEDKTPMDGYRTEIQVTDHSSRVCMDVVAGLALVQAKVFNPWTGKTTHYYLSDSFAR